MDNVTKSPGRGPRQKRAKLCLSRHAVLPIPAGERAKQRLTDGLTPAPC